MTMTIDKKTGDITQVQNLDGVFESSFTHAVKEIKGRYKYLGPKIDKLNWHQLMTFFRWVNTTSHSECQARMFVDPVDKLIRFWAFPQKANTGMTTKEVDGDEFNKQRAELPNAAKLVYHGTVHSHCNMSAFQSGSVGYGGDADNEYHQDGLHITMGKLDDKLMDIHARIYVSGIKMDADLSMYWDIGEEIAAAIPSSMHNTVAKHQMCLKIDVEFPEQWKQNLIDDRPKWQTHPSEYRYDGGMGYHCGIGGNGGVSGGTSAVNRWDKREQMVTDILRDEALAASRNPMTVESLKEVIDFLYSSELATEIMRQGKRMGEDPEDLINEMHMNADEYLAFYAACLDSTDYEMASVVNARYWFKHEIEKIKEEGAKKKGKKGEAKEQEKREEEKAKDK